MLKSGWSCRANGGLKLATQFASPLLTMADPKLQQEVTNANKLTNSAFYNALGEAHQQTLLSFASKVSVPKGTVIQAAGTFLSSLMPEIVSLLLIPLYMGSWNRD
jgi:uncharacterized protein